MNAIEFAATHGLKLVPVGSRVTCDPPPTDTDQDYLVYVDNSKAGDISDALSRTWELGGSEVGTGGYNDEWRSFKLGDENIILTWNKVLYDFFLAATACAKRLNLLDKGDRVALFCEMERHWPGLSPAKSIATLGIPDDDWFLEPYQA